MGRDYEPPLQPPFATSFVLRFSFATPFPAAVAEPFALLSRYPAALSNSCLTGGGGATWGGIDAGGARLLLHFTFFAKDI